MKEKSNIIVLTGFRATGKTTVGKILAVQLGYAFCDTDILLSTRLGASIADIVARYGWPFFRQAERELLREVPRMTQTVIATGGGAIEHEEEWRLLRPHCYVVWLEANLEVIRQRLGQDPKTADQRPSLTGSAPKDEIEIVLRRRLPLYAAGADLRLDTESRTPEELAECIVTALPQ